MNILIRADASIQIGGGHIRRCLTLAEEIRERGGQAYFICNPYRGNLLDFIQQKGFGVFPLSPPIDSLEGEFCGAHYNWQEDGREVEKILGKFCSQNGPVHWLIVDHYGLDDRWESSLRPFVERIMVIDDLANRTHDCDLLLDQNFYLKRDRYSGKVPPDCTCLIGPKYALLRPQFREMRKKISPRSGNIQRIFVFFGESDPTNETAKTLRALKGSVFSQREIEVVVGLSNPHKNEVKQLAQSMSNAKYYNGTEEMASRMARADLALGGGGTTTWERFCLGLPTLVIAVAENQVEIGKTLASAGGVVFLGKAGEVSVGDIRDSLGELLEGDGLFQLSQRALSFTDGEGASRVWAWLAEERGCKSR